MVSSFIVISESAIKSNEWEKKIERPLKDEMLLQRPKSGNLKAKDSHSHTSLLLDLSIKKRQCRNEVLIGEESSGPLPKRQLHFQPGKNGMYDRTQLKCISANWENQMNSTVR
jgi:hypothetical protein